MRPAAHHPRRRALVVDDDTTVRKLAKLALERLGHWYVWAVDAPQCTPEAAAGFGPDLLVLDLRLGEYDGLELLRALRRRPELARTPALFCTGAGDADTQARLRAAPGVAVIMKPFMPQELADRAGQCIAAGSDA